MSHAFAVLFVALATARFEGWMVKAAGWSFTAGIFLFSGSLYVLAMTGTRWLGAVTPFGGTAWIAAWLLLAWAAWRA